ncbi:MerR family transcriptional regulator [Streptomyces sp. NPDC001678]|uniref:MerR family transcriptional regulator n=1 Tax=Streptomyces sp. NPDC001678 TaxID=3364599 RepID=UPI0036C9D96A
MRIGELSRRTGVSERALRYYEEQGLLRPSRRPSGYREYAEDDVRTVGHIRRFLAAGLGTATIAELLPCAVDDGEFLTPGCPELVAGLVKERERIHDGIEELRDVLRLLDGIIVRWGGEPARARSVASGNH